MLLGKKLGMTQLFDENGNVVPVTVVKAGPLKVVGKRTVEKDGYSAIIVGFGEKKKRVTKPYKGFFDKINLPPAEKMVEFRVDDVDRYNVGDEVKVDIFKPGDVVDVTGWTKGRGFQGVVKRWGFHGGPSSHGSRFHRIPGAVGMHTDPGRVPKGKKMPGRMGNRRKTVKNLKVVKVDPENNIIAVKGPVPGPVNGWVLIKGKVS
ncbi:50S ribosomal protein L3 [bacterium]|uniref:Large ribosomal subunit protein uL3 n=1 Tax=candidate division WOR-3 bacterium TaxID=2052148 RepID=A0A7C0ZE62_UNCW3|nr:MAG: 50S ribosomal protein L3 [bacterium]HDI82402.1 50S ribosomal protein L3 [candidate division WOR-3 bacterium]